MSVSQEGLCYVDCCYCGYYFVVTLFRLLESVDKIFETSVTIYQSTELNIPLRL
jgi:hypothetical protein